MRPSPTSKRERLQEIIAELNDAHRDSMKTTKSNWRIEIRMNFQDIGADDKLSKELSDGIARMIGERCPEIPTRCIKVRCDEETQKEKTNGDEDGQD